jgi:hypothetical protein
MEHDVRRIRNATLVLCLFILYCVLLSQGLKANALSNLLRSTGSGSAHSTPLQSCVARSG